jgi:rSAM/selenodomain-associated transferase 1
MTRRRESQRLLVFAKAPLAGEVKTRLQPRFTPQQSAAIHRRLVEHCLATVSTLADTVIELWVGSEHPWWAELAATYSLELHYQQGADLGERMATAFQQALPMADKVVVIGTDCPFIDVGYLQQAFQQLDKHDLVIGPADDGGYVLLGLKQPQPSLFQQVSWGSDQVLQQTLQRAQRSHLQCAQLAAHMDIDRPADVERLQLMRPALLQGVDIGSV